MSCIIIMLISGEVFFVLPTTGAAVSQVSSSTGDHPTHPRLGQYCQEYNNKTTGMLVSLIE